jgi:hypothetical protein
MAFLIPSIQFFFGLPRVPFCFSIHFNSILGNLFYIYTYTYIALYCICVRSSGEVLRAVKWLCMGLQSRFDIPLQQACSLYRYVKTDCWALSRSHKPVCSRHV